MLQRQFLDRRCTLNDPRRIRDERCCISDLPTAENGIKSPKIEPCHQLNYKNETMPGDDCPTVNVLRERMGSDEKPPYFPQPEDNMPPKAEGLMGPIGPWATGRPVFSPTTGMTGVRPVVDRYSMTRYTPAQWRAHNQTFFVQSSKVINNARTIAKNFRQSNNKMYKETDKNQQENRDRLSTRASEIHHLKAQLEQAILELTDEIELLEGEHCRVKQSLLVLITPENISGEFLELRSLRMEPDLVRDKIEDELVKEIALYAEVRALLTQTRQSIEDQLVELKTAKARAEFDITDKIDAYTIESECVGLTNDSPLIMMKPGATRVPSEQSSPEEYQQFTKDNLEYCANVREKSIALRLNLDATYLKVVKDLRSQAIRVDVALAEKIDITEQICQELEKELVNCLNELTDTEQLIEELRGASKGLNDAMKVSQSRLDNRLQRKNIENCRDVPQYGLIEEVKTIQEHLTAMADQLKTAEDTQADLVKSRGDLEREIMTMTEVIHRKTAKAKANKNVKFMPGKTSTNEQSSSKEFTSSSNDEEAFKYDLGTNEFDVNLKKDHGESKTFQSLTNQYLPTNLKPLETAVENSSSLGYWIKSAEHPDTRPAVDKHTLARYSPSEWHLHNQTLSEEAKERTENAKNIAFCTRIAENEIFNQVDKNKLYTEIYSKDRASTIYNWKQVLKNDRKETIDEIENVQKTIERLIKSKYAINLVKNINHDVQKMRKGRLKLDLVYDAASEEIIQERELCNETLDLYVRLIGDGKKYIQELKDAKQKLEQNWSDKKDTYMIETECIGLKNGSPTVHWKPGCTQLPDRQYHLKGHEHVSWNNVAFNQNAITKARIFCKNAQDMIKKAVRKLKSQADKVNAALKGKNSETQIACKYLENDLIECFKSIIDSEASIVETSESIEKLDDPMKCAQTKLHVRSLRKNIEQCRDFTQFSLIDEVKDISAGVSALKIQTEDAEMTLEELKKLQYKLQKEILIKQRTLWVDQDMCQHMRSHYPSDQDLYGY